MPSIDTSGLPSEEAACFLTSNPPGAVRRCLTENLRMVALVEGTIDRSGWEGDLDEGKAFQAGHEVVDVALELAWVKLVEGPSQRRFPKGGDQT